MWVSFVKQSGFEILIVLSVFVVILAGIVGYWNFCRQKPIPEYVQSLLYGREIGEIELTSFAVNSYEPPTYSTITIK